jgi:hypothetical protein
VPNSTAKRCRDESNGLDGDPYKHWDLYFGISLFRPVKRRIFGDGVGLRSSNAAGNALSNYNSGPSVHTGIQIRRRKDDIPDFRAFVLVG